ncbi:MAG: HEAT repeat domain-containing protein [Gammaproteobacteria bacterium]|nr:HEAT repeat domain-containing protein [Gammaproteobacteria bacterium]MDH5652786.1 HEAT repeat domain-containing protein [Gammaproteobacteria bacterium]
MGLLKGFKVNKAIATLLEAQPNSPEARDAVAKLKQIGESAIPKLMDAMAESPPNSIIENLLLGLLDNKTLPNYVDGMADPDKRVVAGCMRILAASNRYDPNRLFELFDDPEIPKNALVQVLLAHRSSLNTSTLLAMLDKVEKNVRLLILKVLDEVVEERSVQDLIPYSEHKDITIRFHIVRILSKFDTEAVRDVLLNMLNDSHKNIRQSALEGLGKLTVPVPVKPLCVLLRDPDLTVQSQAIDTLIQIKDPNTVKYLIDVLQDESEYVRRAAVEVLNEVGDPRAIKDLLTAMRDKDWWVKVRAADALGSIGGPKVVDAVLTLIKDKDEFLRRTAVEILNSIKDERAVVHLASALNDDDWWVRERAADALGQLGDKRAAGPLLKMIPKYPESAAVAIQALGKLNEKAAIKPLLQLFAKNSATLGREILEAVKQLADKEHIPEVEAAIQKVLVDSDAELRNLADETLQTVIARADGRDPALIDGSKTSSHDLVVDMSKRSNDSGNAITSQIIDATNLTAGQVLADRYRVIRQIGKGAFGVVVLVSDTMVNEDIILKFLNPHMASDENVIQRFIHELRYARKITHENVIRIFDFITFGKSCAISMEYFPSHSLGYEMKANKTVNFKRAIQIFIDICKAMAVAHNAGVVHRDLKPANILVGNNDLVKIVDFGLAAAASKSDSRLTKSGILVGTPTYMAPEQVRARAIDARTDIYSLGILMYELFTGKPPYKGEDHMATLFKHVEGGAKPAKEANPEISPELNGIIMKAMATNPAERYQSITDLQSDLENILKKEAA